jgi:signal transduction histidine kinase
MGYCYLNGYGVKQSKKRGVKLIKTAELSERNKFSQTTQKCYKKLIDDYGFEGMKLLDDNSINVIISDQRMPFKSGVSFFEEVKIKYPDTMRIILTAYADYETAYDSINRGYVFRFVQKPWDFEDLSNIIEDSYKIYSLTKKNKTLLSQYQQLFDHHTVPVFIIEKETHNVIKANKCAMEFFDLEEIGVDIDKLFPIDRVLREPNQIISVVNGQDKLRKVAVKHEEINWKKIPCYLISLEDQTDAIDFEKKKVEFISEMQDNERKQLSMELHDGHAQDLVLLKLYFENLADTKNPVYKEFMGVYQKITDGIRSLSYSLNPPDLEDGISEGVQKFFKRMDLVSETNFICEINNVKSIALLVDDYKSYHLYRIIQEFVNNSLKHSKASEIKVILEVADNLFDMKVKDNGIGFDQNKSHLGSGLQNMKDRCRVSSMKFDLKTALNEGTEINISFKEDA